MDTPSGPRALALALHPDRSTSVQLKALSLAVQYAGDPEVKGAMLHLLEGRSTSTSVKLRAIELLEHEISDPEVRRMIGSSLLPSNSTSVQLKAVDALDSEVSDPEVRQALATTIDHEFSTSVVLRTIDALEDHVARDRGVKEAFTRGMQDERMSSTARVRMADGLLPGADERLQELIAESMEDVVMKLSRRGRGRSGSRNLIEDALDILQQVDPERAKRARDRYGSRRSKLDRIPEEDSARTVLARLDCCQECMQLLTGPNEPARFRPAPASSRASPRAVPRASMKSSSRPAAWQVATRWAY